MGIQLYKSGPLAALLIFLFQLAAYSQPGSSGLPILLIDTYGRSIRDEPKIVSSLKIIDKGPGNINHTSDIPNGFDGTIGIEIRGQSSQMFPKKSYGFEIIDAVRNDADASLLGMPEDSDWILYAPYSDKSLLRNALTYHLGRRLEGEWQPRYRFCDLYINDTYAGIYMLVERIKRGSSRVDINRLKPDEIGGNSLTGGYIIKVDKINGLSSDEYFLTFPSDPPDSHGNNEFTYVYPGWDEINSQQKTYIQNYIQTVEWSLRSASSTDPENGFRNFLDEDSFIDFQIMQELTNNVDGYKYSTYFYKKRDSDGGKLFAGPLWDFDLCYGNVDYSASRLSTTGWLYTNTGNQGDHR
ncbi:MAG: CotH kinase family protein, partial [Bacteroidales bacterium]|nr:CotH kinase family protein [Bacteroidales bacterium]